MKGPYSYTGEDVVEIHCHGGALVSKKLLNAIINSGARHAEPGEFTFRGFINGKMDLTQAEAVGDIITAHSDMALKIAEKQIDGVLGAKIKNIRMQLIENKSEIESRMDFSEEELDWKTSKELNNTNKQSLNAIKQLLATQEEGTVLREGVKLVIAGRPNVGKSSLLNLLLGYDRAIVTSMPGTTRDTLEEYATLRNIPVKMIDTAGIRESDDIIESKGIERSITSIDQANIILWLMNAAESPEEEFAIMQEKVQGKSNIIPVWNKADLLKNQDTLNRLSTQTSHIKPVIISVSKQKGLEELLDTFEKIVWHGKHHGETETAVSARHAALLETAQHAINDAMENIAEEDWELAAIGINKAISSLGSITGETIDPDILDTIFSKFCIGK
jgi:tRNA modification GTPase